MTVEKDVKETVKRRGRFFILGPCIMLSSFSHALTGVVLTDLIVYRTCLVSLGMNETECLVLRNNASSPEGVHLEGKVEPHASMIIMTKSLIESLLPAVLSIFYGSWSDRGGRRPLLVGGFTGFAITFSTLALICSWNISPWYLLLPSIPSCITGGLSTIILASICHISDSTTEKERMVLMAWLEASVFSGEVLGGLIAPPIYGNYGYLVLFRIAATCSMAALTYAYFCIPETVKNASQTSIRELFKISLANELVTSHVVKREGFHRSIAWLAISTITLNAMIDKGHATIEFLFTRARLSWSVQHYFYFNTAGVVLRIVGLSAVLLRGRISDTILGGIGFVSALGSAATKCLAWKNWHMYIAAVIGMFSGIMPSVLRSIISRFVPAESVGKVFSLATLLEVLSPLGGSPLYTMIYSHYLPPIYPSPVFLVSVTFFIFLIFCVVWIDVMTRKARNQPSYIAAPQDDL